MDLELRGRRAVVTGGSRGIGREIARQLAIEGAGVAIVARGLEALQATAAELGGESASRVHAIRCDTGSDDSVRAMVVAAVEHLGGLDVLVNCAAQPGGQAPPPKLPQIDDEVFWPDINVKVMGYLRCIRESLPHLRPGSRIVNVSGLAARSTGSTIGSMRNVAVAAMTKNLADELGPKGISVVCVHPGLTRTERTADVLRSQSERRGVSSEDVERDMARSTVLNRLLDAREVAWVVTFLCSPRAVAINGDSIAAGGGQPGSIHY
ncbi:MAG: SDR family oxidoreductase [Candidatus Dormibacteraeota bacterium]|nr:SDR family oxidoreductase [Candidatus Dormibacteraeota bacterium]